VKSQKFTAPPPELAACPNPSAHAYSGDPIEALGRLFDYSEWLDGQGLIKGEEESGDPRTHEQLVADYLAELRGGTR
jgi:hypothetical protein